MARRRRGDHLVNRETLLREIGVCRAAIVSHMPSMKAMGPLYSVASGVIAAIDALATVLTGHPHYFHEKGTTSRVSPPSRHSRDE
jgi:hypothetical protein